jgi:lipopolysaccharide/colanic/teichoic acid biosynthesis glycosyltransferase
MTAHEITPGCCCSLTFGQRFIKRTIDLLFAIVGLIATSWLILIAAAVASLETRQSGFFTQRRVGRFGRPFSIIKIRTMRSHPTIQTVVTTARDPRITRFGRLFRRLKIDELPQLLNVLIGHMSLVGPRPDVEEFADMLSGPDRVILTIRPGITGPATLRFRHEETELARQSDPERYNREVIFPEKVRLNREYIEQFRLTNDLFYLLATLTGAEAPRVAVSTSSS